MLGQMDADPTLGAGKHDVALDKIGEQPGIDTSSGHLHPPQPFPPGEHLLADLAEHDVDVRHGLQHLALGRQPHELMLRLSRHRPDLLDVPVFELDVEQYLHMRHSWAKIVLSAGASVSEIGGMV